MLPVCVVISLLVHGMMLGLSQSQWWQQGWRSKEPELFATRMEVDLTTLEGLADRSAIMDSESGLEIRVPRQLLPQLAQPVRVEEVEEAQQVEDQAPAEPASDDDVLRWPSHQDQQRHQQQRAELKKRARDTLVKQEALRRLLKEEARKKRRFAKVITSPQTAETEMQKSSVPSLLPQQHVLTDEHESFHRQVRQELRRFYALPEVYRRSHLHLSSVVQVVFDDDGRVVSQSMERSSRDRVFDDIVMESLQKAQFPSPPKDLVGVRVRIHFNPGES